MQFQQFYITDMKDSHFLSLFGVVRSSAASVAGGEVGEAVSPADRREGRLLAPTQIVARGRQ